MKDTLDIRRLCWLGLLVLVLLAWRGALDAPFVYDDKLEVVGNATIRVLDEWRAILTYRPSRVLVIASYAINYHFAELDPVPYHIVNLIIHGLCVGAALSLAEALGRLAGHARPLGVAVIGVGLWAVHPMTTQAVTYITGRSESLCALFCLVSLSLWAQALLQERATGKADMGGRILSMLAAVGALLSKEVGVMLPPALLLLEIFFPSRGPAAAGHGSLLARLRAVRWLYFLPLAQLVVGAMVLLVQVTGGLIPREVERPLGVQLLTQAEVWMRYVALWLLPVGQTVFHVVPDVDPLAPRAALAGLGWIAMVGLAVIWGQRVPLAGFALSAGALFLIPSSSVAPLKEHMAEHRAYALGLWLALAIAWSVSAPRKDRGLPRAPRLDLHRLGALVGVALIGFLPGLTDARNAVWSSEVALWREATARNPESGAAWYGLGDALRFEGKYNPAMAAYQKATELDPSNLDAWNNLGISRAELGDVDGASEAWRSLLRRSPTYCKAHNNLGFLALRRREWDMALIELNTTLSYCPDNVLAHWGLGNVYFGPRREPERAIFHYQRVLDLDPDFQHGPEIRQRLLELTW